MKLTTFLSLLLIYICTLFNINAIQAEPWLASYQYPYPVHYYAVKNQCQKGKMAYMDVKPTTKANAKVVVLFHGKNFFGAYWGDTAKKLAAKGYRVIIPDQIGFGKSSKLEIAYTLQILAKNTHQLLESLGVHQIILVGHSLGGMLAARYALMYPDSVSKLVLEDPLGLEDYRLYEPYTTVDQLYKTWLSHDKSFVLNYQKNYYFHWDGDRYSKWAELQAEIVSASDKRKLGWISSLLYEMIYTQPVVYELKNLKMPVMFIAGANDNEVAPGKMSASPENRKKLGHIADLVEKYKTQPPYAKVVLIPRCGHLPHIEQAKLFMQALLNFIN